MPNPPGDPLRKVTLNLFEEDCAYLETHMGHGWSEWVRNLIHAETRKSLITSTYTFPLIRRKTLGDLDE